MPTSGSTSIRSGERVTVYEVGPRDGLQNEAHTLATADKIALIRALREAGLTRIEATSFVRPEWIPQLADAEALCEALLVDGSVDDSADGSVDTSADGSVYTSAAGAVEARNGVVYSALVPNQKGLQRALAQPAIGTVAVFLSSSESHNKKNVNRTVAESLRGFEEVIPAAKAAGRGVRAYVSAVWGCPIEGHIPVEKPLEIARELRRMGADQISLGDTIGVGTPLQTQRICETFLAEFPPEMLALHLHDTRGTALANALVGLQCGIRTFDASVGGLGGCPYAPGASGNLATEDLVYMLHGMELETGVSLDKLVEAGLLAQRLIGRELPGRALRAAIGTRKS